MSWGKERITWMLCGVILVWVVVTVTSEGGDDGNLKRGVKNGLRRNVRSMPRNSQRYRKTDSEEWSGKWFPGKKEGGRERSKAEPKLDKHGRIPMGQANPDCDDAKTNLTVDWDFSEEAYTCYGRKNLPKRGAYYEPVMECYELEKSYTPLHFCMNDTIPYDNVLPTHGDHRPLWPIYGEYLYVPPQRWLHNIEHGGVVMLYHPCADPSEVDYLRELVVGCVGKYVITAERGLSKKRPLALVSWGCRLMMSMVDEDIVTDFIRSKAFHGPEAWHPKEGQYDETLIRASNETGDANYMSLMC